MYLIPITIVNWYLSWICIWEVWKIEIEFFVSPNSDGSYPPQSSSPPFCYGSNFSPLLSHRWQINTPSSQEKPSPNFCSIVLIAKGRILWSPMEVEDLLNQTTTNRWASPRLLKSILTEWINNFYFQNHFSLEQQRYQGGQWFWCGIWYCHSWIWTKSSFDHVSLTLIFISSFQWQWWHQ